MLFFTSFLVVFILVIILYKLFIIKNCGDKINLEFKNKTKLEFIIVNERSVNNEDKSFSVLTYNILTQKYVKRKDLPCLKEFPRISKIISEIKEANCDIFCLQECTYKTVKFYIKRDKKR